MIRYVDCRSLSMDALRSFAAPAGSPLHLTAWQAAQFSAGGALPDCTITVPDFLNYARMLNTGQAAAMLRLPGSLPRTGAAAARAGIHAALRPGAAARMDFWLIASALLRYDLALVPPHFHGTLLLHSYVADLAFAFDRRDFVAAFFKGLPRGCRGGIETQQLAAALSSLERWGRSPALFSFLLSEHDPQLDALRSAQRSAFYARTKFVADITNWPRDLQDTRPAPPEHVRLDGWSSTAAPA
jgi:hypothetical protein